MTATSPPKDPRPQGYYHGDTWTPARYVFESKLDEHQWPVPGEYCLRRRVTYVDQKGGAWTVPAKPKTKFETDLASIPSLLTWLVPRDGTHTPAAIIHDAMTLEPGEVPCYTKPHVSREEGDRIFREGMQFLGVYLIRRWLMWTAVSIPTFMEPLHRPSLRQLRVALLGIFVIIGLFGVPDVLDLGGNVTFSSFRPWGRGQTLGWQLHGVSGEWHRELFVFMGIVLVGTGLYAASWLHRWRFGLVAGLALSFLTFPIAILGVTYLYYWLLEQAVAAPLKVLERRGRDTGRVRSSEAVETAVRRLVPAKQPPG